MRPFAGLSRKRRAELAWWTAQRRAEGELHAAHYERLFTEPFELDRAFFAGRSLTELDADQSACRRDYSIR